MFSWPRASRSCSPGCRLWGDLRGEEVWGPRFPSNRLFPLTSVTRPPAGLCLFLKLTAPRSPRCRAPGRPRGQRPRCLPTARGAEREGKAPELRAAGPPRPLPGPGGVTSVWKATEARSGDGCAAALHTRTPSPTLTAPRGPGCEAAERGRRGADTWPPPTAASVPRAPRAPGPPPDRAAPRGARGPTRCSHAHARLGTPRPGVEGARGAAAVTLGSRSRPSLAQASGSPPVR